MQSARRIARRVLYAVRSGPRNRAVWEAICAITQEETGGRLAEPSPYEASADVDWMVIVGMGALARGHDARLAMIDAADPMRGELHALRIEQIERRAEIVQEVWGRHFPRRRRAIAP